MSEVLIINDEDQLRLNRLSDVIIARTQGSKLQNIPFAYRPLDIAELAFRKGLGEIEEMYKEDLNRIK